MKEKIESMKAPAAIGPYSQAVNNGGLVFVSGQLPIDCETGEFVSDDVSDQTRQSLFPPCRKSANAISTPKRIELHS